MKERTADELLRQYLTKGPRASAEAAGKTTQVAELRDTIAAMQPGTATSILQDKMEELEAQIDALSLNGDEQSRAVADKAAYVQAKAKIDEMMANKLTLRDRKATEAVQNSEKFLARLAEVRVQLMQLEQELAKTAMEIADKRIESTAKIATQVSANAGKAKRCLIAEEAVPEVKDAQGEAAITATGVAGAKTP